MPKTIDITGARTLIRTRAQLLAQGLSERDIQRLVAHHILGRVRATTDM